MGRAVAVAIAAALSVGSTLIGSVGASTPPSPTCGPAAAGTLASGHRFRVYTYIKIDHWGGEGREVSLVFACRSPGGRPLLLGSNESGLAVYHRKRIGVVDTRTITSRFPWVAYPKSVSGVDTSRLTVVAVNLRTNKRKACSAGFTIAPARRPVVTAVALKGDGSVGWIGVSRIEPSSGRGPLIPVVGACDDSGVHILDSGEGIDRQSLRLRGSTLTWADAGETRSASLE